MFHSIHLKLAQVNKHQHLQVLQHLLQQYYPYLLYPPFSPLSPSSPASTQECLPAGYVSAVDITKTISPFPLNTDELKLK